MKVLVVGSGGREHALSWRLGQSASVDQVYCVPGNAGMGAEFSCLPADVSSNSEIASLAESLAVDLTVIGPEAPLTAGIVDEFGSRHLAIVGPSTDGAQLEGSKVFAKEFMQRHGIPTAEFALIESESDLDANLSRFGYPVALKADGLAAGKGVVIVKDETEARRTAAALLSGEIAGDAALSLKNFSKERKSASSLSATEPDSTTFLPRRITNPPSTMTKALTPEGWALTAIRPFSVQPYEMRLSAP